MFGIKYITKCKKNSSLKMKVHKLKHKKKVTQLFMYLYLYQFCSFFFHLLLSFVLVYDAFGKCLEEYPEEE